MKKALLTVLLCGAMLAQTKTGGTKSAAAKPDLMNPKSLNAKAPDTFDVKFTTTKGVIVIRVTRGWAPRGADRFYNLVRGGFFTNCAFFRVIPGFMAQFGLNANPAVSKAWEDARIIDDPVIESNKRGRITYAAQSAPNTRTTQLFINFGDNAGLDTQRFAPFGEVVDGMSVVDQINAQYKEQPDQGSITAQGNAYLDRNFPKLDKILSATIVPAAPPAPKPPADAKQ